MTVSAETSRQAPLWTAAAAAEATGGAATGSWSATGVSIDSRKVAAGDLFVALAGPSFDGHDFVGGALTAGAVAAMVHRRPADVPADAPLLEVADTFAGLHALGAASRARSPARIAAVTGSVGKTGTKEALRLVLARQAPTAASEGNLNNHWGAPLSLARLPADARYGVFELGMNHPGEIAPLSRMVRPHVAVITTIAPAHTAFFPSLDGVADAKAEIFEGVEPGGSAVLNHDNPFFDRLAAAARAAGIERILSFGHGPGANARLVDCTLEAEGSAVEAEVAGRRLRYRIGAPGRHWVLNSLAVLLATSALGADVAEAAESLRDMQAPAGRGRRQRIDLATGSIEIIDESYNASPEAVRAALAVLALAQPGRNGRRLAVLGDMLELGDDAPAQHAALASELAGKDGAIDRVYAAGPGMASLFEALPAPLRGAHTADTAALAPLVAEAVRPGDVVLVKGSLGMNMARVMSALSALAGGASAGRTAPAGHG